AFRYGPAVDDVGIERIGRGVAALAAGAERLPVAHRDAREASARADADGAAVLLRARHPVGKRTVGRDPVDLRRRLVQPRAPRRMIREAVDADDGALIAAEDHAIPIVGRNPQLVVVVAARRALERLAEGPPAVARAVDAGI